VCACCHGSEPPVWRIKDGSAIGGKSEPLHEACAPRFFCDDTSYATASTASLGAKPAAAVTDTQKEALRALGYSEAVFTRMSAKDARAIIHGRARRDQEK
jgi:hypothetical protein